MSVILKSQADIEEFISSGKAKEFQDFPLFFATTDQGNIIVAGEMRIDPAETALRLAGYKVKNIIEEDDPKGLSDEIAKENEEKEQELAQGQEDLNTKEDETFLTGDVEDIKESLINISNMLYL